MENYVAITQIVVVLFQPLKMDSAVCATSLDAHFPLFSHKYNCKPRFLVPTLLLQICIVVIALQLVHA